MDKLVLTADQIYALAYIMKAEYLDFYYITASTRDDNTNWLFDVTNQLVSLEILDEDFSGNTTIKPEVEELVKPLYFGKKESSLDIDIFGEKESNNAYRFHFLDDKITMEKKSTTAMSSQKLKQMISGILYLPFFRKIMKQNRKKHISNMMRMWSLEFLWQRIQNSM